MSSRPRLDIQELCVDRGMERVLHGIDLTVDAGEVMLIQGSNGSGKSTLLETVAGLLRRRSGQILLSGERVDGVRADTLVRRGVALIHQERHLFPRLTVREHLELAAFSNPHRGALESVDTALERWNLVDRSEVPAGLLSGGEQRMVALARGLRRRPDLLLLDEPLAALAPALRQRVLEEARRAAQAGTAVVIVEHDIERVGAMCDRTTILVEGRVMRNATIGVVG
ncbi:MAG: ATP-binding cassette domain-containing protein [Candidatus Dormibacteria bacterium]